MRERDYEDRREVDAGRNALAALELVGGHMDAIRTVAMGEIINSRPEHVELRERMIVTCQIMDAVKSALERSVAAGDAAQHRIILSETVTLRR